MIDLSTDFAIFLKHSAVAALEGFFDSTSLLGFIRRQKPVKSHLLNVIRCVAMSGIGDLGNPLRKFKLVFLGEQSG